MNCFFYKKKKKKRKENLISNESEAVVQYTPLNKLSFKKRHVQYQ